MVSPIFIVGSIAGWAIVTRSAPSGKWEIRAMKRTMVPYENRMGSTQSSGAQEALVIQRIDNEPGENRCPAGLFELALFLTASAPKSRRCASMHPLHRCAGLQLQFHIHGSGDRIRTVGRDFLKTDFTVHRHRIFHYRFDGVEAHALVAHLAGFRNDAVRERTAQALATKRGTQVEALHFTDSGFEFMESNASGQLGFILCQQKAAVGRGVVAGEAIEFLVEVLKAEAEAEGLRVFEEEFAGFGDLRWRCRLD